MRQNILITGASSGLGAGLAREFCARSRTVALCARRIDRLTTLRAELLSRYPEAGVYVRRLDVDDHDSVADVFDAFRADLGGLDRIVVNAGVGGGRPIGTGGFQANRRTAMTNFLSALAQCEAALSIFRAQGRGHLVVISSVAGVRGLPGGATTYAATKSAVATLAEGIRADVLGTGIVVSTIFPGYIRSEMNEGAVRIPFMVDTDTGCRALAAAIERESARAFVPRWPWAALALLLRHAPVQVLHRLHG